MGLRATHIRDADRRDRLLLLVAMGHTLLTLLGAASEACGGMDAYLKVCALSVENDVARHHACTSLSQKGLVRLDDRGLAELVQPAGDSDAAAPRRSKGKYGTESLGFNLHAGVRIEAQDRAGREKLLRYCTRAPLSLERLSMTRDGRVAYRLQRPWRRGETHRVMDPVELLARLSAMIPPPRYSLLRFHGVLGPHSSWRKSVVPEPTVDVAGNSACATITATNESAESAVTEPPSIQWSNSQGPWRPGPRWRSYASFSRRRTSSSFTGITVNILKSRKTKR